MYTRKTEKRKKEYRKRLMRSEKTANRQMSLKGCTCTGTKKNNELGMMERTTPLSILASFHHSIADFE